MEINFIDETNQVPPAQQKEVDSLLQFAADFLNLPEETEMSVTFMNNDAIQEINRVYRQKDVPTDVISFAFEETKYLFLDHSLKAKCILSFITEGKNSLKSTAVSPILYEDFILSFVFLPSIKSNKFWYKAP